MFRFSLDKALMVTLLSVLSFFALRASAAALPLNETSALEVRGADTTWFHLQSFVVDQKYHKAKPSFVSFTGGDGSLTESKTDAAKFWIWRGQLGVGNKFVHLDFSNGYAVLKLDKHPSSGQYKFLHGRDQWLHVQGRGISYGEGSQAIFCHSDDGSVFLQGHKKPPFACRDIGFSPRQRAGPAPRSPPPHQNRSGHQPQSSAIPTVTVTVTPPSVPTWWVHQAETAKETATPTATNPSASSPVETGSEQAKDLLPSHTHTATATEPHAPDPSSDDDWTDKEGDDHKWNGYGWGQGRGHMEKPSFEFDVDGEIVE